MKPELRLGESLAVEIVVPQPGMQWHLPVVLTLDEIALGGPDHTASFGVATSVHVSIKAVVVGPIDWELEEES